MPNNSIQIAIDGPSGSGKSTIAKALAAKTSFVYMDSGALYRAAGLYITQNNIDPTNEAALMSMVQNVKLDLKYIDGQQRVLLNGEDVTTKARTAEAGAVASSIVGVSLILRKWIVDISRELSVGKNIIMDGRDIGTVIFPNADLKIYLDASAKVRAKRRVAELVALGHEADYNDIFAQISQRDYRDKNREISPLKKATDAVVIDTSRLYKNKVLKRILELMKERGLV
ncbi:MAG: (d)CMP kinase [Defluviitaleaceae bacterium]|nr:(d)CMP kinase [Defluviitaleaceae bacterium]